MGGICAAGASGAAGSVPRRGLMVSAWSEEPGAPCGVAQGGCHTPTAPWGPQKPLVRPAAAGRDPGEAAPLARWVVWGQGQEQGVPPAPGLGRSRDPSPGKLVPVSPSLLALSLLIPTSPSLLAPGLSQALPAPVPGNCQHVDPPVSQEPVTSHPGSGGPFPPQNIFFQVTSPAMARGHPLASSKRLTLLFLLFLPQASSVPGEPGTCRGWSRRASPSARRPRTSPRSWCCSER